MVSDRLNDLEGWLRELGRPVADLLLPGAAPEEIDQHGPLPDELKQWFGWHNGVAERPEQLQGDVEVFPSYRPVSLAEAAAMKPAYEGDEVLGDSWFPLLASGGGDLYAAVWTSNGTPRVAGVLGGEPTEIEFDDVDTMLGVFVECYRRGVCTVGPDGHLQFDPARYESVYEEVTGRGG